MGLPPWQPWIFQTLRFQGGMTFPGINIVETIRRLLSGDFVLIEIFDLAFVLLFLSSTYSLWKRLPRIYSVYQISILALFLMRYSGIQPLLASSRYVLTLFPSFIVFGLWGENPWANRLILYISWVGLLFLSGQFAIWGWVG